MRFKVVAFLVIITRVMDGISTYICTPDLKYETNPLVSCLGFGWISFIVAGIIFTSFIVWLSHYSFKEINVFKFKANSFSDYVSILFLNEPGKISKLLYTTRWNKQFWVFIGLVLPVTIIYSSIFFVINNLFMVGQRHSEVLNSFYAVIYDYYPVISNLIPFIIFLFVSYSLLSRKYVDNNSQELLGSY